MSCINPDWVSALGSILAVGIAWCAIALARNANTLAQATLIRDVLTEYGQDEMRKAMELLSAWHDDGANTSGERYLAALKKELPSAKEKVGLEELKAARRRVSHYFKKLERLCEARLLRKDLLARLQGFGAFEFAREILVPIDDAHHRWVKNEPDSPEWAVFFLEMAAIGRKRGRE